MTDHHSIFLPCMLRKTTLLHGVVDRSTKVIQRIQQGAVEVEYDYFGTHGFPFDYFWFVCIVCKASVAASNKGWVDTSLPTA